MTHKHKWQYKMDVPENTYYHNYEEFHYLFICECGQTKKTTPDGRKPNIIKNPSVYKCVNCGNDFNSCANQNCSCGSYRGIEKLPKNPHDWEFYEGFIFNDYWECKKCGIKKHKTHSDECEG